MSKIDLRVNGRSYTVDIEPANPLLYALRNDLGQCGACKVIISGAAGPSCIRPTFSVKGEVTTLAGLAQNGKLHPLQQALDR